MPHTITKLVYKFDELEPQAKETARQWFRDGQLDYDWYDFIYEDAERIAAILGIELDRKPRNNPKAHAEPAIWFSGFYSQGDGACFDGRYSYAKGAPKAIRAYAPTDTELHRIADELQSVQRKNWYKLTATTKHRGHYYHSGCMAVDVDGAHNGDNEEILIVLLRDFADWIYRALEKECEWLQADEQVDDSIRANEYEFDESGNIV